MFTEKMLSYVRMDHSRLLPLVCEDACKCKKVTEYDQVLPQSHIADGPSAP